MQVTVNARECKMSDKLSGNGPLEISYKSETIKLIIVIIIIIIIPAPSTINESLQQH